MLAEHLCLATIWYRNRRPGAENIYRIKTEVCGIILEFLQDVNNYVDICGIISNSEWIKKKREPGQTEAEQSGAEL